MNMNTKKLPICGFAAIAVSLIVKAEGASLLVNGNFEGNGLANGSISQTTNPVGWIVVSGETDLVNNALGVIGTNGPTWLEIGGLTTAQTVMQQMFVPSITGFYNWGFDYTSWFGGGQYAVEFTLIDASDNSIIDFISVTPSSGNGIWQEYRDSGSLNAGTSYIFRLTDAGVGSDPSEGAVLDNAFVTIPEPSTIIVFAFGSAGLFLRRSRKKM
jgi:hypothetical protein